MLAHYLRSGWQNADKAVYSVLPAQADFPETDACEATLLPGY